MALLLLLGLDAAKILEKIEGVFLEPELGFDVAIRLDLGDRAAARVRLGEGGRLRLTQGRLDLVSDGRTLVRSGPPSFISRALAEGEGRRLRLLLARGGVHFWASPLTRIGDRWIYAGEGREGELELVDLAEGPAEGTSKSIRYALRRIEAPEERCAVRLVYDPATFRPSRREVEGRGRPFTESYSGWTAGGAAPAEAYSLPMPPGFGTQLRGKIARRGRIPDHGLSVGCVGAGHETATFIVGDAALAELPALDGSPLSWDPRKGLSYWIKKVPPGPRLVYIHYGERYFDWKWIEVPADARGTLTEIDFTLAPGATGDAEIRSEAERVYFMPADEAGRVPSWTPRLVGDPLGAKTRDGKALFRGLRPGKYVFYPSDWAWESRSWIEKPRHALPLEADQPEPPLAQVLLEVKAGETARAQIAR